MISEEETRGDVIDLEGGVVAKKKRREKNESGVISQMMPLNSRRSELLDHPIVNTFVMIKYNSYASIIIMTILIKFLLSIGLSIVLYDLFPKDSGSQNVPECQMNTTLNPEYTVDEVSSYEKPICDNTSQRDSLSEVRGTLPMRTMPIVIILVAILAGIIGHTLINMFLNFKKLWGKRGSAFFFQLLGVFNYSATVVVVIFMAFFVFEAPDYYCMRAVAALIITIHWGSLTTSLRFLMIGKLYNLGFYVRMLDQIIQKVAFFVLLYSPILMGFTMGFNILMPEVFEGRLQISRTVAMTIGEFDYDDKFNSDIKSSTFFSRTAFVFFAILCPIILSNLLIGLTVSDVEDLIKNAHISGLGFKVRIIDLLDDSRTMKLLSFFAMKFGRQSHLISYQDNSTEVKKAKAMFGNILPFRWQSNRTIGTRTY